MIQEMTQLVDAFAKYHILANLLDVNHSAAMALDW